MPIGLLVNCVGCRPKRGFPLGGRISQERMRAVQSQRGREGTGTCGLKRTQLEGGATVLERLLRRRFAEQSLELGLLGEMAAGGAGARGDDHGTSEVRHFEGKMKKGMESLGHDINYI